MDAVTSAFDQFLGNATDHLISADLSRRGVTHLNVRHIQMPLKEPFETAKRRAEASDTVIVEIITDDGTTGLGAATPVQYVTEETIESVIASIENAKHILIGRPMLDFITPIPEIQEQLKDSPGARAAIEIAGLDAAGKITRKPVYRIFGGRRNKIETDVTIPVVPAIHAGELAAQAGEQGFRQFKVKVGSKDPQEDAARALAITRAVPHSCLVVDANQGFKPDEAIDFMQMLRISGVKIALFEQPVNRYDIEGLMHVKQNVDVPVFADESVCSPEDFIRIAEAGAVTGVNIKLMKSGFFGALKIAVGCRVHSLKFMLGCMLEPRIGIAAAVHLACSVQGFQHYDLDADLLLAEQGVGCFVRDGAVISPITFPGLGCLSGS